MDSVVGAAPNAKNGQDAPPEEEPFARLGSHRGRVLKLFSLLIVLALLVQLAGPYLAPPRIVEGPLVQQARESDAVLVWYTTREIPCTLEITEPGGARRQIPVETSDRRHVARITELSAATVYRYEIAGVTPGGARRTLATAALHTNKTVQQPFTFVVLGDSGRGTQVQYRLGSQMAERKPDFVVHTGDLVYPAGERKHYQERFFQPYKALLASVTFWPSLGNHDFSEETLGGPYRDVFELPANGPAAQTPENNYWFDYASARFVVLDSNLDEPAMQGSLAPWVSQTLSASTARWKFVVFHHPPYTFGKETPTERVQRTLVPVFEQQGVDVVFNGHDHMYQRMLPLRRGEVADLGSGVVYLVSGAGGASLYQQKDPKSRPAQLAVVRDDVFSFTTISIDGGTLRGVQTSADGDVIDEWSISK